MKHSPAPWYENHSPYPDWDGVWFILDADGKAIVAGKGWDQKKQFDTRLIAKAPEMYKILKDINVKYPMYVEGLDKLLKEIENE